MSQRRAMFHMNMNSLTYHLDARQWLPADRIMQDEASKPIDLRPAVCGVVNTIRSDCFNNASKPSGNAIKKRYKKYFLGSEKNDQSLVEEADRTMMELIAYRERYLTPPELVKEIRTLYFPSSPSALHTPEGIVKRYRNLEQRDADRWTEADEWMEAFASQNANANTERFPIGVVVEHIKNEFFLTELSVTRTIIEDRYCRKFLRIDSNTRNKARYDMIRVTEAMSKPLHTLSTSQNNASSTTVSTDAKSDGSRPSFHESLPERPKKSMDESSIKFSESDAKPYIFPTRLFSKIPISDESRLTTLKRMRPESLASASGFAAYRPNVSDIPKVSTAAQEEIYRDALRRSGFWSASNASTADQNSTISRMSRGDVEFRACPFDHTILNPGGPCVLCNYPEVQPKPVVFLAPEFETAPYTNFTEPKTLDDSNDDDLYTIDPTAPEKQLHQIMLIPPHKLTLDGNDTASISQEEQTMHIPQIDIVDVDIDIPVLNDMETNDTDDVNFMFLAEEFIGPRADIVDADDMDNGMLTLNANIRSWN